MLPLLFFAACDSLTNEPKVSTVSNVTVSLATVTVANGKTQQFTAAVSGNNNPAQSVTWTVEGSKNGTTISADGTLNVAADESAATLTVRATSTVDTSKSGTASVTVSSSGQASGVTVSPSSASVVRGQTKTFTTAVSGGIAQTVTWSIVETSKADGTSISDSGVLIVAEDESLTTLTIKATSTVDSSKSGTASVTVYASESELPTVTSVTVSPATTTVAKGGTQKFTAAVSGDNNPAQTVTWTVEGGVSETSIIADGTLSVAVNESAATLTVRATSTVDSSKSGTASVSVEGEVVNNIAGVQAYLNTAFGGATAADPVSLPVQLNLADTSNGWAALLDAIQTAGKFVALGLSSCTISGTEYDPGTAATGKSKIVSLVLPNAATSIKAGSSYSNPTFKDFSALTSVSGSAVETIGSYAFYDCTSLATVSLPAVTSIGSYAFYDCTSLTTVSLPAASSIGSYAFYGCDTLTTVSLPATLIISGNPFGGCINLATTTGAPGNPNYSDQDSMLLNKAGTTLIAYPRATGVVTLNTVTSIGGSSFYNCDALTTVSLPAATSIGSYAFYGCDTLTTVSFPVAASIGSYAFSYCTSLTTVSLPVATSIGNGAFSDCDALTTVSLPAATSIGNGAFSDCTALTEVSLPAATSIGNQAFIDCDALTTVSLPAATSIGNQAFIDCDALTTVSLPAATSIGNQAFAYTSGNALTVTLGSAVPTLAYRMFDYVSAAKTVTVKIPSNATGYGSSPTDTNTVCWGNGFRGNGWNGSGFVFSGSINSSITLTIEEAE